MFQDYYEILGTGPDATMDEIKRAFRKRAREEHPDLHPENSKAQTEEMRLLNEAYSVLSNPRKRRLYDYEWRRYYNIKGTVQRSGGDESDVARTWRKYGGKIPRYKPESQSESRPFWKDQRFLLILLIILFAILAADIYATYFRGHTARNAVREIGLSYEFLLGKEFRHNASERHLDIALALGEDKPGERMWRVLRALALDPENIDAISETAETLREQGRHREALRLAEHGLAVIQDAGDEDVEIEKQLLTIAYRSDLALGNPDAARDRIVQLLELDPDNGPLLLELAWAELTVGNLQSARDHFMEFIEKNPESNLMPQAKASLAETCLRLTDYQKAMEIAQSGLEQTPDDPGLHLALGEAYYFLNEYNLAIENLKIGLPIAPDPLRTEYMLGRACLSIGNVQEAIEHFRIVLESDPDSYEGHMGMGDALYVMGRLDDARDEYFEAARIRPDSREARNALERVSGNGESGKEEES
jgi:curved DNA-binding protein CbpA/Flp pilus assembly protein TadD